jgi:hypothetical protein
LACSCLLEGSNYINCYSTWQRKSGINLTYIHENENQSVAIDLEKRAGGKPQVTAVR